jgi:hypothetical protein
MEYEFIEFKEGQRWKTRMGKRFIIKEVREDEEYALVCISMDTGKKHFFDEDGFEVPGYPTDNDLVEQIS